MQYSVLFGFVFSLAYTPLQAVVPTETLEYNTRAKGLAVYGSLLEPRGSSVLMDSLPDTGWQAIVLAL